jgi:hypothetical protein
VVVVGLVGNEQPNTLQLAIATHTEVCILTAAAAAPAAAAEPVARGESH